MVFCFFRFKVPQRNHLDPFDIHQQKICQKEKMHCRKSEKQQATLRNTMEFVMVFTKNYLHNMRGSSACPTILLSFLWIQGMCLFRFSPTLFRVEKVATADSRADLMGSNTGDPCDPSPGGVSSKQPGSVGAE